MPYISQWGIEAQVSVMEVLAVLPVKTSRLHDEMITFWVLFLLVINRDYFMFFFEYYFYGNNWCVKTIFSRIAKQWVKIWFSHITSCHKNHIRKNTMEWSIYYIRFLSFSPQKQSDLMSIIPAVQWLTGGKITTYYYAK